MLPMLFYHNGFYVHIDRTLYYSILLLYYYIIGLRSAEYHSASEFPKLCFAIIFDIYLGYQYQLHYIGLIIILIIDR